MSIDWTRIKNDVNGNPRFVCHFLNLNTRAELDRQGKDWIPFSEKYALALHRARKIGGRKFHNKQFGGGIVFQEYAGCLESLEKRIAQLLIEE